MHIFAYYADYCTRPVACITLSTPKLIVLMITPVVIIFLIYMAVSIKWQEDFDKMREENKRKIDDLNVSLAVVTVTLQETLAEADAAPKPTPAALLRQLITAVAPSWAYAGQVGQAEICNICLQPFQKGAVVRRLKCGHIFHAQCTDKWFQKSFTCGYCRRALF